MTRDNSGLTTLRQTVGSSSIQMDHDNVTCSGETGNKSGSDKFLIK